MYALFFGVLLLLNHLEIENSSNENKIERESQLNLRKIMTNFKIKENGHMGKGND